MTLDSKIAAESVKVVQDWLSEHPDRDDAAWRSLQERLRVVVERENADWSGIQDV